MVIWNPYWRVKPQKEPKFPGWHLPPVSGPNIAPLMEKLGLALEKHDFRPPIAHPDPE